MKLLHSPKGVYSLGRTDRVSDGNPPEYVAKLLT